MSTWSSPTDSPETCAEDREGTARFVTDLLRRAFKSSLRSKAGFALSKPALNLLKHHLDPTTTTARSFLGLNGLVVKSQAERTRRASQRHQRRGEHGPQRHHAKIGDDLDNFRAHAFNEAAQ